MIGYFAAMDVLLVAFPVSIFWTLHIRTRVKIGLSILVGSGLLYADRIIPLRSLHDTKRSSAAACSIARTIALGRLQKVSDFTCQYRFTFIR